MGKRLLSDIYQGHYSDLLQLRERTLTCFETVICDHCRRVKLGTFNAEGEFALLDNRIEREKERLSYLLHICLDIDADEACGPHSVSSGSLSVYHDFPFADLRL